MARPAKYEVVPGIWYGAWQVLFEAAQRGPHRHVIARCECGNVGEPRFAELRDGRTTQCLECKRADWVTVLTRHHTSDGRIGMHVARANGIGKYTYMNRVCNLGWSVDDAATRPVRPIRSAA